MSKESFIGGDYIETTGGDVKVFGNEIANSSISNKFVQNAGKKIVYKINEKPPLINPNVKLKRFLVHFRRPNDYNGKYGFDWLREEYIYPLVTVTNDNNGTPINAARALCKNPAQLKQEYRNGVANNISPYGVTYYPAWLAVFPYTTTKQFAYGSTMHKDGVSLDLQFDEIDKMISDGTEILFESKNQYLKVAPQKIIISDVIAAGKKSRNVNGKTINFYKLEQKINIKCIGGALKQHEEIKVFAKLDKEKVEVGKLMVYKNSVIPMAEIVVVKVKTKANDNFSLKGDYQFLFKRQSFNQGIIRAEVKVDTNFDLTSLKNNNDVKNFLNNMNSLNASQIQTSFGALYEKYGKYSVKGGLDGNTNKRTYLFLTSLSAGNTLGICSLSSTNVWGNQYVVFNAGLKDYHTIMHECGHSLSLPHVFQEGSLAKHTFYHGYTDNYMDYTWQAGNYANGQLYSSGANKYKGKMFSFFKWQWDIMRKDRSLIQNY